MLCNANIKYINKFMFIHSFIKVFLFQRQNFVLKYCMKSLEILILFLKWTFLQELNVRWNKVKVEIVTSFKWVISLFFLSNKTNIVMWVYLTLDLGPFKYCF